MSRVRLQIDRAVDRAIDRDTRRGLIDGCHRIARALGIPREALALLGLRIVDDATMIALHRDHMGTAKPTDVLSFPGEGYGEGDIAIDWDQVRRQAAVPTPAGLRAEAEQLLLHALVHLCGHDHATPSQARRMRRTEARAARRAALPQPTRPYGAGA